MRLLDEKFNPRVISPVRLRSKCNPDHLNNSHPPILQCRRLKKNPRSFVLTRYSLDSSLLYDDNSLSEDTMRSLKRRLGRNLDFLETTIQHLMVGFVINILCMYVLYSGWMICANNVYQYEDVLYNDDTWRLAKERARSSPGKSGTVWIQLISNKTNTK